MLVQQQQLLLCVRTTAIGTGARSIKKELLTLPRPHLHATPMSVGPALVMSELVCTFEIRAGLFGRDELQADVHTLEQQSISTRTRAWVMQRLNAVAACTRKYPAP